MSAPTTSSPFITRPAGSFLETTAILGQLLRPEGYTRDVILDIATALIVDNERENIRNATSMHLMALKKTLLYAIPVVAPPNATYGIPLTSQAASPAIQYDKKHTTNRKSNIRSSGLAIGDKFRLLGFVFPDRLVNHLSYSIYHQKYYNVLPDKFRIEPLDISSLANIETHQSAYGKLFIIKQSAYEDTTLFNRINRALADKLIIDMSVLFATQPMLPKTPSTFNEITRMAPYNNQEFITNLNSILESEITPLFSMSLYEVLSMTANWLLYDQITLLGFKSADVEERLRYLRYAKEQNLKVRDNIALVNHEQLLSTRAEKICRDKYPYFFDYSDRRALFIGFNRFVISKLPEKERDDIKLLLDKDLVAQEALLRNKCEHLKHIEALRGPPSMTGYHDIEPYINLNSLNDDGMYSCKLCGYPMICIHLVELYETISAAPTSTINDSDNIYWAKQHIINKFKLTNQRRQGNEDTEISFTYYCKYCGADLGKSEDIIQTSIKTVSEYTIGEADSNDTIIMNGIVSILSTNMNTNTIPFNKRTVAKLIFSEIKDKIASTIQRGSNEDDENTEIMIRYLTHIYTLVGLIALNINKVKSPDDVLISAKGGIAIKTDFITALKIIKSVSSYKRIGITDDKIKSLLIEAFRSINHSMANDTTILKTPSYKDRLELNIRNNPLTSYAEHIYRRFGNGKMTTILEIMGIDIYSLFPKKRKKQATSKDNNNNNNNNDDDLVITSHALFKNMYQPNDKSTDNTVRYIIESYMSLVDLATLEPLDGKFISVITPPLSDFMDKYQQEQRKSILLKSTTPIKISPAINGREHEFSLNVLQLAYCVDPKVRLHHWHITKDKKMIYTCEYCGIKIEQASKDNNSKIDAALTEQMLIKAFFEFYTVSCPVKDAHIFENGKCIQCEITKSQLRDMDRKYYDRYSATYLNHRTSITNSLISNVHDIINYASPVGKIVVKSSSSDIDLMKLESIATNISKLFDIKDLNHLGEQASQNNDTTNKQDDTTIQVKSFPIIDSYARLLYSHYIFAKNMTIHTTSHPDSQFFTLLKKLLSNGTNFKSIQFPELPKYPETLNGNEMLLNIFNIILDIISKNDSTLTKIIEFILKKIVEQDQRHKQFNFARLKAMPTEEIDDDEIIIGVVEDDNDDENADIFNGYDIDNDDMEDNVNGEVDDD